MRRSPKAKRTRRKRVLFVEAKGEETFWIDREDLDPLLLREVRKLLRFGGSIRLTSVTLTKKQIRRSPEYE